MPGNRRSIRLKNYDYKQEGAYYVTICVNDRKYVFGNIKDDGMLLNDAGKIVEFTWMDLTQHNDNIELDEYIVMPNHIHGIINIVGAGSKPALNHNSKPALNHNSKPALNHNHLSINKYNHEQSINGNGYNKKIS